MTTTPAKKAAPAKAAAGKTPETAPEATGTPSDASDGTSTPPEAPEAAEHDGEGPVEGAIRHLAELCGFCGVSHHDDSMTHFSCEHGTWEHDGRGVWTKIR